MENPSMLIVLCWSEVDASGTWWIAANKTGVFKNKGVSAGRKGSKQSSFKRWRMFADNRVMTVMKEV